MTISPAVISKKLLRNHFRIIRDTLLTTRRIIAENKVKQLALLHMGSILSFASKPQEINLWLLNATLAHQNRLLLPKTKGKELLIYEVTDLNAQLLKGRFNILEPDPTKCKLVDLDKISCILVPGLAFDKNNHRIGYGGGYFDRFLEKKSCHTIGVGFLEQLSETPLLPETHDIKLNELFLC